MKGGQMGKKSVKFIYKGQEIMEESHAAAIRVFKDRSQDELECFASLPKHSSNGCKRYLTRNPEDLYPSKGDNKRLIEKAEEFRPGWFISPNIGPKTLTIIFKLVCKCSDLEFGIDLTKPEWN